MKNLRFKRRTVRICAKVRFVNSTGLTQYTVLVIIVRHGFPILDRVLKQQLIPYMKKLYERTQIPMILVSHSPKEMAELAEEIVFIADGKVSTQVRLNRNSDTRRLGGCHYWGGSVGFQKVRNLLIKNHTMHLYGTETKAI